MAAKAKTAQAAARDRRNALRAAPPPAAPRRRRAGALQAAGFRFAIVVSRFNEFLTARLRAAAEDTLLRLGALPEAVTVIETPGAFEIAAAARRVAPQADAVICLGVILRGETPHFDCLSREVARGIGQSALETGVPHAFGVLTCDSLEQALQRAGGKAGNKGAEAALAAVEMANLFAGLQNL